MPKTRKHTRRWLAVVCPAALCLAIAIGISAQAHADLSITGANARERQAIDKVYDIKIPARFHSADDIDVQVFDRRAMLDYIHDGQPQDEQADQDDDDTIDGIYEDGPPTVTLRATNDVDDLSFTFAHEYGHYVWQDQMNKAERKRYAEIYARQRAAHHLVTSYAASELDEGFAEAFSFYAMAPAVLAKRDPLSYQFLSALHK